MRHMYCLARVAIAAMVVMFAAGCATAPKPVKTTYYFFPPAPDEPRLQFLTAFSSEKDLRGGEEKSLMMFLTGEKSPDKDFGKPYGAAASNSRLFVCDTDLSALLAADLKAKRMNVVDAQGEGALKLPLNVTFDADGGFYVADVGREQVVIFDKDTNYVAAIGKTGEIKPRDVAVNATRIYVADLQNHCVKVYDKADRKFLFDIPRAGERTNQPHALFTPTNLALDSKGHIYVGDTGAFRIQVYDAEGNFVRSVGEMGDSLGQFARVKGIAVDRENRLYAADAMSQAIQIFDENGRLLTWFAEPESSGRLQNLPAKVVIDYEDVGLFQKYASPHFKVQYLVMVINQLGPHKVSIYGFGQRE